MLSAVPTRSTPPLKPSLQEQLLAIMDRKHHPAWPRFTEPGLTKEQLAVHFRHEYLTYVRDFPVLLARLLGQSPPSDVRAALAENIFEEQTGKLSLGVSHPELFLEMIDGLQIPRSSIERGPLTPEAVAYRAFLDEVSFSTPWVVGAAVLTIFVEGSVHERAELSGTREVLPVDEAVFAHPMVKHYGCPPEKLRLIRAHRAVESGHRKDAWQMVSTHAQGHENVIVRAVSQALQAWLKYRDGVVRAMDAAPVNVSIVAA
ncbi:MAG: iron-containing redox enzyme family protein [Polyangiaceae bacterium]|nr:iron-containing redox enzyme family protein [Polyangiaceae bacterium]